MQEAESMTEKEGFALSDEVEGQVAPMQLNSALIYQMCFPAKVKYRKVADSFLVHFLSSFIVYVKRSIVCKHNYAHLLSKVILVKLINSQCTFSILNILQNEISFIDIWFRSLQIIPTIAT